MNELSSNICHDKEHSKICENAGGKCMTEIEGYYVESVCCVIIGFLWLGLWGWRTIKRLQEASEADWRVVGKIESNEKHKWSHYTFWMNCHYENHIEDPEVLIWL